MKKYFDRLKRMIKSINRDRRVLTVFMAVGLSFVLAIIISIFSLRRLADGNRRELDTMLTYRIYESVSSSLNEPIVVSKTMACDDFLISFLQDEDKMSESEAVYSMRKYLSSVRDSLGYDSAFLVSENSRRYYTYDGLNKIVDPVNDEHDVWYSIFLDKDVPYDLDVDSDEMNEEQWTVFVNTRIVDDSGKLLGVCGVGVKMSNLQCLFLEAEEEYGVKINLVDAKGLVQVDTEDINIENAWLDEDVLGDGNEDKVFQSVEGEDYVTTKYVEYLGWYLVVRSKRADISREVGNVISLNIVLLALVMAVLVIMVMISFITDRKMQRTEEEAAIDRLTGLYNKFNANEKISTLCAGQEGTLMIIDLDSFKLVNDIYGHDMGDRILIEFARIIRENMSVDAVLGRIGGDEFIVFAIGMKDEDKIEAFSEAVNRDLVEAAKSLMGEDMSIPLGASIGVIFVPEYGTEFNELFRLCDRALYVIKSNGKHGYSIYNGDIDDDLPTDITLSMLSTILEERNIPQNAMWMGKEAFGNVYRYMVRYMDRYSGTAYKVLFTAKFIRRDLPDAEKQTIMVSLRELLQESLRGSDIMMQLGYNHFFLMLPQISDNNISHVIDRIMRSWKYNKYSDQVELTVESESMVDY